MLGPSISSMNPTSSPLPLNYSCISDEEENPDPASIFKPSLVHVGYINRNSIESGLVYQSELISSGVLTWSTLYLPSISATFQGYGRQLCRCGIDSAFFNLGKYHRGMTREHCLIQ